MIPEQLGEFVIQVKTVDIFSVNGFHGNSNLGYLCLQAKSAELYHCGLIPVPGSDPPLRVIGCMLPSHLKSTLYPTLANSTLIEKTEQTKRDMISLAVQIKSCPDQNLKVSEFCYEIFQIYFYNYPFFYRELKYPLVYKMPH